MVRSHDAWMVWVLSGKLRIRLIVSVCAAERGMRPVERNLAREPPDHLHRAGDGVGAVLGTARMGRGAVHGDENVDAAAVAERRHQAGATEIGEVGPYSLALDHAADRGVAPGLAGYAADMDEAAFERHAAAEHRLHGDEHRSHVGLLLARTLAEHHLAGESKSAAVGDIAGIGVRHRRRRLVHGVGDQHQRLAGPPGADGRDQVSHGVVADLGEAHGAQARLDRGLDEGAQQRLRFHQRGLRAGHAHEFDEETACTAPS